MNFNVLKLNQVFIEYVQRGSCSASQWGYKRKSQVQSMLSGRCEKVKVMGLGKGGEGGEVGGHRLRPGDNFIGQR